MAQRPANGQWSILENVRHLLFAEQLHLGRFVSVGQEWSPLGYTPQSMREARKPPLLQGQRPVAGVAEVLAAWDTVHLATTRALAVEAATTVPAALERNLKHLRTHIRVIERIIR